jgi:hypothetical protein
MRFAERSLVKDTVLNVGMLAMAFAWVLVVALQCLLNPDAGSGEGARPAMAEQAAAGLTAMPVGSSSDHG